MKNTWLVFLLSFAFSPLFSQSVTVIINDYTPVLGFDICKNELIVADATKYNPGDTVLIIQMKGAVIDSGNTSSFGTVSNYKNAGNYEFNYVKSKSGNVIQLKNNVTRQYDIPAGKVQLIRVPYYQNFTITNTLTCLPWDGTVGGILVFNVQNTLTMNADIDVSGRGFRGGMSPNPNTTTLYCNYNDFYYPAGTQGAAEKGESIANINPLISYGKGPDANGGGGGNGHNSGGGGGSNAGGGGLGGYQLDDCGGSATDNRGLGGKGFIYNNASNKIFMGGGGGAGHTDNAGGSNMNGGNGGGIVIINTPTINSNNFKIVAKGGDAPQCNLSPIDLCHDGSGGGGGAGTILIESTNFISNSNIDIRGGKGGDLAVYFSPGATKIGPGGGGGAGLFWSNSPTLPANVTVNKTGGINGVIIQNGNNPYGTTPGQDGINLFNLKIPVDITLFKPNIDSVRINNTSLSCNGFDFKGIGYTNTSAVTSWKWTFGDGTGANTQNATHVYTTNGNYTVKLVVTDVNNCMDSISKPVTASIFNITKSNDTAVCETTPVQLIAGGGVTYLWTPSSSLNNASISNPVASPLTTTTYYVTVTSTLGCSKTDSIEITINALPTIAKSRDTGICNNTAIQLFASGGVSYSWAPASSLNNSNVANPVATPLATTTYYVTVTNSAGCSKSDSVKVTVGTPPAITKSNDTSICKNSSAQLFAAGGVSYIWTPAASLSNSTVANPVATPAISTTYYVKVINAEGCAKTDSVKVMINPVPLITTSNDTTICNDASVQLFASGGNTYLWSPAASLNNASGRTPIATPLATTDYIVSITDGYTCTYKDSVKISVKTLATFTVSPDASICSGGSKQLLASGGDTYSWSPSSGLNNPNISNPVASPVITTTYTVTIYEYSCNETATLSTVLTALALPNVNASSGNDITCSLGSSQLNANGAADYNWTPATGLDNSSIPNPVATPLTTTLYTVTGKNASGCSNTDKVSVKVDFNLNALYLLPNSFTPNGDGINDCFGVKYWGQVSELDFNIYNRFGEKVFHTSDANICWDGRYKQAPQDANIFVYTIKAKTACGQVERKGIVALVR